MKYFLDTEFIEGPQTKKFMGFPYGKTKPTIDLISVGLACEDGREFYAISNEFNLDEAWNRFQIEKQSGDSKNHFPEGKKNYWLRDNILKPIFEELHNYFIQSPGYLGSVNMSFDKDNLEFLIKKYGKSNMQISKEIQEFVGLRNGVITNRAWDEKGNYRTYLLRTQAVDESISKMSDPKIREGNDALPEFYAYFADYDWVVFCWIFGKMIDLPKGFPQYCKDLKQMVDSHFSYDQQVIDYIVSYCHVEGKFPSKYNLEYIMGDIDELKKHKDYPKNKGMHNALADANWNKNLYEFLKSL